ncbi:hypothetical protein ACVW19_004200 [Streptomyces sp. TE5632]
MSASAGLPDRLAVVEGFEDGEFAAAFLDDPGDAEEVLRALGARERRPLLEGLAGGLHGAVDVRLTGLGDLGEDLLGGGGDGLEDLAVGRLGELAVDEQAVRGGDVDDRAGLGRRRVVENRCHGDQSTVT